MVFGLIALIGCFVFALLGAIVTLAGFLEMITGRNAPGWLGGSLFYRRGLATEPQWSSARWRYNGFFVIGFGFAAFIVSITLLLVVIGRLR